MADWNPHDPALLGPEYLGGYDSQQIVQVHNPLVQRFRSDTAETVAAARLHLATTDVGTRSRLIAEVVAPGQEADDAAFTTVTFAPNALAILAGTVREHPPAAGVTPTTPGSIDEWAPSYTDYLSLGGNAAVALQFASAAAAPSGRIAAVAVELVTQWGTPGFLAAGDGARRAVVSILSGGVQYGSQTRIIPNNNTAGTAGRLIVSWGEINPVTGRPWTPLSLGLFDSTREIRVARQTGDGGSLLIAAARLIVVYETTERRLARGVFDTVGAQAQGWTGDVALAAPDGTANWAKAAGADYSLVLRQADQGGLQGFGSDFLYLTTVAAVPGATAPSTLLSSDGTSTTVTHLSDGNALLATQVCTGLAEVTGRVVPFVLRTTAPATSPDSQPYSAVEQVEVRTGGISHQELTATASDDYAELQLSVGYRDVLPEADLVVTVRRRSDDVAVGDFTVTTDDLAIAGATAGQLVGVDVKADAPGVALVAATQYYLDYTSATPAAAPWIVGLLAVQAEGGGVLYQEGTYGGGTDVADPIAAQPATGLAFTPADFAALLAAAIDGPTGLTVTPAQAALPAPAATDDAPQSIPYAAVTWTASALGSDFAGYQLQRLGADGVTWQDIAFLRDESVELWADPEARLGVAECYRIRVQRIDGATSYWSAEVCATVPADGCGYYFTSAADFTAAVAYTDSGSSTPERGYQLNEADEAVVRTMYGRDLQVVFRPTATRGEVFARRLLIANHDGASPVGFGPDVLDPLRDLSTDPALPYVAVRDELGNRWMASVLLPEGITRVDGGFAWAQVQIIETTATPYQVVTDQVVAPAGDFTFVGGDPIELVGAAGPLSLV